MPAEIPYEQVPEPRQFVVREQDIEDAFIEKLRSLKYTDRPDIRDRASLEKNFRQKFEALNRVTLTDAEFARLLDDLVSADVFKPSVRLREKNDFTRDDGTPLSYTLVNIRDWCKNDFEVVHQLRINTDYSQLEGPPRRRARPHGRARAPAQEARRRPRHLRTQRLRILTTSPRHGHQPSSTTHRDF